MGGIAGTIVGAAGMFAGTNVDDIIVLTVLFLTSRTGGAPRPWQIWAGQYAGIAILVLASVIAALGLTLVPKDWVGLLGVVPIALGVRGLISAVRARNRGEGRSASVARGLISVVGVTIAGGADNVCVYTPVFRAIGASATLVTVTVFAAGVAVWCLAASRLASHKKVIDVTERYGHWIVPPVFIVIGVLIIAESGVLRRLA